GHAGDEVHVSAVAGRCWIEEISHHPFGEFAAVARVLDWRRHFDPGDSAFRGDPEPDLVAPPAGFARRARWRKNRPPRRGGENITRPAARARAGIRADAGPGARSGPA